MAYDINSIQSLTFREGVRQRVSMYLGTDDIEGAYQAIKEILNNSTDEALAGYGKQIDITLNYDDNRIAIRDFGRGVPFGIKPDGENVLVSVYTKSHTGGKFDKNSYKNSSGLNGIGGSCVCLSSKFFKVISVRDGVAAEASFIEGNLQNYKESKTKDKNGTYVEFIPDEKVFSNGEIQYDYDRICRDIKDISYLYSGIIFNVDCYYEGEKIHNTYCAKNGILDFVKENNENPLHKTILTAHAEDENDQLDIAFQWGKNKEQGYIFVNGLRVPEGGSPITGAKAAITKTFNNLANAKFDGDRIRDGLFYVINCKVANPSFANQTKSKINNPNLRTLASNAFTEALKKMSADVPSEFKSIVDLMSKIAKADAAAEKAREAILNHEKKEATSRRKKVLMPEKFKDCEKHGENSTLIITEGNSALAGLNPARNVETDALYAVRGKIKNLLKHPVEECLENQEVSDIITLLGCGIMDKYNNKKLNYGKVAIASDGDTDGLNIMCLVATLFMVLIPDFVKEGRLCWLRAPLYRIGVGNKRYYAYNDEELKNYQSQFPKAEIGRYKGLGEMRPEDVEESMFHTENQHLECLTIDDFEQTYQTLVMLMGKEVSPRRDYLFENVDFSVLND